jgi:hypothetical protein
MDERTLASVCPFLFAILRNLIKGGLSIMEKTERNYPDVLKANDIAGILCVSIPTAYKIMRMEGFPLISLGRNMRTLRDEFFQWLKDQSQL